MAILSNKKFLWIIIILLIIINLFSITAIWKTRARKPMFTSKNSLSRQDHFLYRKLDFSSDQQVIVDSLVNMHRGNIGVAMKDIGALRKSLIESIQNDTDQVYIDSLVKRIGNQQMVLEKINYHHFREVLSICNPDQKKEFLNIMDRAVIPDRRFDRSKRFSREKNAKRSG